MDLAIWVGIGAVTQAVTVLAASHWYRDQLYMVSPAAAIVALVMMRWGAWAGIHAVVCGGVLCLASGAGAFQYLIYCGGNLLALAALLLLRFPGKAVIRKNVVWSLGFALLVQILMQLGRAGLALALGYAPETCFGFLTTDALSGLFTLLIIGIARRTEGLFEDQKSYLLRIQSELNNEGRGKV